MPTCFATRLAAPSSSNSGESTLTVVIAFFLNTMHRNNALLWLTPVAPSQNVWAVAEPRGEVRRRVVVTGMGVVTPIGLNVPDFWASMQAAKVGVSELGGFPLEDLKILIAAQIKDFDPKARLKHFVRDKLVMHADRYSWFAAAAADANQE